MKNDSTRNGATKLEEFALILDVLMDYPPSCIKTTDIWLEQKIKFPKSTRR
jgi:hypothetical protein